LNDASDAGLPQGWRVARFDEILTKVDRKIVVDDSALYNTVGVHLYGMGAFVRQTILGLNIARKQQWLIRDGDIVYNKLFAWKGTFAVADEVVDGCIVSDKFPTYLPNLEVIDPKYLGYYFRVRSLARQAEALSKGAAAISKLTLNPPQFWDLTIPVGPLSEQHRIASRIEELSKRISGASKLRQQAIEESGAIMDSSLRQILESGTSDPDWQFRPIAQFAEINPSRRGDAPCPEEMLVSFIPMSAVDDVTGTIVRPIDKPIGEVSSGHTRFRDGDVIFARITPCMQNGKCAFVEGLTNGIGFGSTEFHVLRPRQGILGRWLHRIARHKDFRDDAARHFKGTAGQKRVPQTFLEQKVIPVPPLEMQQSILAYLDDLESKVNSLKQVQGNSLGELEGMLPSVLDRGFKGEL
jgi:type I restriction enzyme S subunit